MSAAIQADGLGKRYRKLWALRDCALRMPSGRVTALVGPNGAGKTTLLKLVMGLLAPTTGDLQVLGCSPVRQQLQVLNLVGFMAENRPLYPYFTVAETMRMGRELNPRWDTVGALGRLRRHGIPLDRQVRRLSNGQQAQVSLALALGKRPELLLLDEPAAALDPLARRELMSELLDSVAAHGTSVVLSSHVIADLERACDHLVILNGGRVQLAGDIDTLLEEHRVLVGLRREAPDHDPQAAVIAARQAGRETVLLVRRRNPSPPSGWRAEAVNLEELVLAYLANPRAGATPGPVDAGDETAVFREDESTTHPARWGAGGEGPP